MDYITHHLQISLMAMLIVTQTYTASPLLSSPPETTESWDSFSLELQPITTLPEESPMVSCKAVPDQSTSHEPLNCKKPRSTSPVATSAQSTPNAAAVLEDAALLLTIWQTVNAHLLQEHDAMLCHEADTIYQQRTKIRNNKSNLGYFASVVAAYYSPPCPAKAWGTRVYCQTVRDIVGLPRHVATTTNISQLQAFVATQRAPVVPRISRTNLHNQADHRNHSEQDTASLTNTHCSTRKRATTHAAYNADPEYIPPARHKRSAR